MNGVNYNNMQINTCKKKVLLYSGGMDSFIINKLWKPDVLLYFDYGISQNEEEIKHLPSNVIIKKLNIGEYMQKDGINTIPLRNLIFASIAINYGEEIAIGGLKSDLHFDKKPAFAEQCTALFNSVLEKERQPKTIKISIPFADYSKTDLVVEYLRQGYTLQELNENSWSCHTPVNHKPCGHCQACNARNKAITEALRIING